MVAKILQDRRAQDDRSKPIPSLGRLRLQVMEAGAILEQILALRTLAWSGRISLSPDVLRWGDALDTRASHWCIFGDAELVAAGRLSIHASFVDLLGQAHFAPLVGHLRCPVALMSHEVVHPRFRGLRLVHALDAARMEQARQVRCASLLARADTERRASSLRAAGFEVIDDRMPAAGTRPGRPYDLFLDLSPGRDRGRGEIKPRVR